MLQSYLTAARGEEGERVEPGDGMIFHSPQELFTAYQQGRLGVHAKVRVRLPIGLPTGDRAVGPRTVDGMALSRRGSGSTAPGCDQICDQNAA